MPAVPYVAHTYGQDDMGPGGAASSVSNPQYVAGRVTALWTHLLPVAWSALEIDLRHCAESVSATNTPGIESRKFPKPCFTIRAYPPIYCLAIHLDQSGIMRVCIPIEGVDVCPELVFRHTDARGRATQPVDNWPLIP